MTRDLDRPWTERVPGAGYGWFCASMRHEEPALGLNYADTAAAADGARKHLATEHAEPVKARPFWSSALSVLSTVFLGMASGFGLLFRSLSGWAWLALVLLSGLALFDQGVGGHLIRRIFGIS